jgi:hypothetical protein
MGRSNKSKSALEKAREYGIDLTLLYERLSWTPTERIQKNLQMLDFTIELRKAGEKHRGQSRSREPAEGTS